MKAHVKFAVEVRVTSYDAITGKVICIQLARHVGGFTRRQAEHLYARLDALIDKRNLAARGEAGR